MTEFCQTTVAETIYNTLDAIRELGQNATFLGKAGVGKSFAISHYVADNPGQAWMLTATDASGGSARHLFRTFCKFLDISASGSIAEIQDRIFAYELRGSVLIIDEAQNLNAQGIRELLYLNSGSNLAIAFCGNYQVIKNAHVDEGPLDVIGSRIQFREKFTQITANDAETIAGTFGVTDPDSVTLLRGVGAKSQARGLNFVLTIARKIAGIGEPITLAHLKTVLDKFPQHKPALPDR